MSDLIKAILHMQNISLEITKERNQLRRALEKACEYLDECPNYMDNWTFDDVPSCDSCHEPSDKLRKDCWLQYFKEEDA